MDIPTLTQQAHIGVRGVPAPVAHEIATTYCQTDGHQQAARHGVSVNVIIAMVHCLSECLAACNAHDLWRAVYIATTSQEAAQRPESVDTGRLGGRYQRL